MPPTDDDVRAVGRVAGLVRARVAGREVEASCPAAAASARMFSVAIRNGSAAPHSASPPKPQLFETLCSVGSLAASSIASSMPTSRAVAAGVREAGARRRRRRRTRTRSTSSRRACATPWAASMSSAVSTFEPKLLFDVAVLEDEEQVVGRDRLRRARARRRSASCPSRRSRVDRDRRVAGRRSRTRHRRLALGAVHSVKPIVWPVAVEAVAGDVVEAAEIGREVAAAAHVDAERVDHRVVVGVVVVAAGVRGESPGRAAPG